MIINFKILKYIIFLKYQYNIFLIFNRKYYEKI